MSKNSKSFANHLMLLLSVIMRLKSVYCIRGDSSIVNLVEKFKKFYWPSEKKTESVASRFIRLFESHGVHRNQIPRFFDHGLTLKDVQDDDSLILKLDEEILEAACTLFAVKREWLDGAETIVLNRH